MPEVNVAREGVFRPLKEAGESEHKAEEGDEKAEDLFPKGIIGESLFNALELDEVLDLGDDAPAAHKVGEED